MAMNDSEFNTLLSEAPPSAPTAQDAEQDTAAREAAAAKTLAASATATPSANLSPNRSGESGFETPASARPGSFGEHLSNALQNVKKSTNPEELNRPGSWSKLMVGATMDALSSTWGAATSNADATRPTAPPVAAPRRNVTDVILGQLGDAAAAPGPGGVFGGFARAAAAGGERTRQEHKDRELMAESNARMLHEQALTHKLGEDQIQSAVASGKAGMDALMNAEKPATLAVEGKTSDELKTMIDKGELDPTKQTVFLTGRIQTGADKNGQPTFRSTYSVINPAGEVKMSEEEAKYLNENLHMSWKPGQTLSALDFNHQWQQAQSHEAATGARKLALAKINEQVDKAKLDSEANNIGNDKEIQAAVASAQTSENDPHSLVKAYNALINNKKFMASHPNFTQTYPRWAGGGDAKKFETMQENFAKVQDKAKGAVDELMQKIETDPKEMEGHTPAVLGAMKSILADPNQKDKWPRAAKIVQQATAVRQLELDLEGSKELTKEEAKQKAQQRLSAVTNPDGLTGEAFIKTLPVGRANTLRAFFNGDIVLNPTALERTEKGQAYLDDVYTAYPDLDASKAPAYAKMRVNYTTGKEATGINASNTALHHLNRMSTNLDTATAGNIGKIEQFFGGNEAGRRLTDDSKAVASELGRLYSGGVVTEGEMKDWEEKLNPNSFGMTTNKLKTNVKEFAKLLGGKLEAYQAQWDDGLPSKFISAPKSLASIDSQSDYKKITGDDLKIHPEQTTAKNTGATPAQGYKTGQKFMQNGHQFTVTAVDEKGNITGAE